MSLRQNKLSTVRRFRNRGLSLCPQYSNQVKQNSSTNLRAPNTGISMFLLSQSCWLQASNYNAIINECKVRFIQATTKKSRAPQNRWIRHVENSESCPKLTTQLILLSMSKQTEDNWIVLVPCSPWCSNFTPQLHLTMDILCFFFPFWRIYFHGLHAQFSTGVSVPVVSKPPGCCSTLNLVYMLLFTDPAVLPPRPAFASDFSASVCLSSSYCLYYFHFHLIVKTSLNSSAFWFWTWNKSSNNWCIALFTNVLIICVCFLKFNEN